MKKKIILIIILLLIIIIIPLIQKEEKNQERLDYSIIKEDNMNKTPYIIIEGKKIIIEIAKTPSERTKGLMYRESLEENKGMLFIFEKEDYHPFWMKNTLIPLDIIFIDKESIIIDLIKAYPCKEENCPLYTPKKKAQYVVEVNKDTFEKEIIGKKIIINLN
jgi:uncharacterized protein